MADSAREVSKRVGLVGCGKRKLDRPAVARELYTSTLFRLASRYCSVACDRWFVLSAKHGLVAPEEMIAPYDQSLQRLSRQERQQWAERVIEQLRERGLLDGSHCFELHAGADYAQPLAGLLGAELPLAGLSIGRRLAWYRDHL